MKLKNPIIFLSHWLLNLNLFGKILALALILMMMTIGIGWIGIHGTSRMNRMVTEVIENNLLPILYLNEMKKEMLELDSLVKDGFLNQDLNEMAYTRDVIIPNTEKMLDFYSIQLLQLITAKENMAALQKLRVINGVRPEYIGTYRKVLSLYLSGDVSTALETLNGDAKKIHPIVLGSVDELIANYRSEAVNMKQRAAGLYNKVWNKLFISLVCILMLALILSYGVAVYYGTRIHNLTKVASEIAEGNLNSKVQTFGEDELGRLGKAFEHMGDNLRELLGQNTGVIKELVDCSRRLAADMEKTSTGSAQVAAVSEEISLGVSQQEQHIVDMVNSMEQLRQFTKSVMETAIEMLNVSTKTAAIADKSRNQALVVLNQIQGYHGLMLQNREAAHQLDVVSNEIQQMMRMVAEIADQINLLSLNASIEAARAGEHGQGFAVVAESINDLSDRTHELVKKVQRLTGKAKHEIERVIASADMGVVQINEGNLIISELGGTFLALSDFTKSVEYHVHHVTQYVQDISRQHEGILTGMHKVAAIAEDNALDTMGLRGFSLKQNEVTIELAELANRLNKLGSRLVQTMARFKLA